jgi:hypothetical protein
MRQLLSMNCFINQYRSMEEKMSRYLGNKNTKEVHDTLNEKEQCQLKEIKEDHKKWFDLLSVAHSEGFDNCAWCIGNSKR